jgi:sec-independent protein translocase protein TatA
MGAMSPWHWAILAVIVVLLFGAKRLPDAARSVGSSMRIFKSEVRELHRDAPESTCRPLSASSDSLSANDLDASARGPRDARTP